MGLAAAAVDILPSRPNPRFVVNQAEAADVAPALEEKDHGDGGGADIVHAVEAFGPAVLETVQIFSAVGPGQLGCRRSYC